MNRDFLKEQGLSDEQIESVMKEHGKTLNDTKTKADKVDGLESQIADLTGQIQDRDTQLEDLKKVDAKALQKTIDDLQESNKNKDTEYQDKLDKQAKDFAIDNYLRDQKARNPKAVKALLDLESISFKNNKLTGIDEQVTPLRESEDYLFDTDKPPVNDPQIVTSGNPRGGGNTVLTKDQIMKETDDIKRQKLIQENNHLFQ